MTLQPGQILLHYHLGEMIGQGGMGAVYRATDTKLNREVALKVLPADMAEDPARLQRFQREAQAVAALNHSHIVTIHAVEQDGAVHFLTMELVEGTSLDRLLTPHGLPLAQLFDIGIALADALAAAHDKGIVHRDLKPGNVMVTPDGRIKVLDFGLAKFASGSAPVTSEDPDATSAPTAVTPEADSLTREGTIMGTAPYMSPEQLKGKTVDHRTDIFALGVVLYEMCVGSRPFAGEDLAELISSIMRDAPRSVTDMRQDVPRHLGRIIGHCLEKSVTDRYQSALDIRNELRSLRNELGSGASAASGTVLESGPVPPTATMPSAGGTMPSGQTPATHSSPSGMSAPVHTPSGIQPGSGNGIAWGALGGAAIVIALGAAFWFGTRSGSGDEATSATPTELPAAAVASKETNSLAVLPFADRSPDGDQEYFTDGLSEELMNALGRTPDLRVAGRTSSFAFKGKDVSLQSIGEQLGVANILEGSVRKSGDQIRVSVQLVTATDGFQLWSQTYDRTLDDVFAVQDEIARSVATALKVTLLNEQATTGSGQPSAEAYDLVLQARFVIDDYGHDAINRAESLLGQALKIAPEYGLAWAELGRVHLHEYATESESAEEDRQFLDEARKALLRALSLDPDLAVAHSRLSWVQSHMDWDFAAAERSVQRALKLAPQNMVVLGNASSLFRLLGRFEESLEILQQQLRADPLSQITLHNLAITYYEAGRLSEMESTFQRMLEIEPENHYAYRFLGYARLQQGRIQEARDFFSRFFEKQDEDESWRPYLAALVAHFAGNREDARQAVASFVSSYGETRFISCAQLFALTGDSDQAFEWLDRALAARTPGLPGSRNELFFGDLRNDPRWNLFWQEVGFPADG